jgi:hypothetical protein
MKAVAVLAAQLVGVAAGVEVRGLQPRLLADRHSNPRGRNEEGWNRGRYGVYHDLDNWRRYMSAAGFNELTHYYRPAGLPREQQPWLASVWRRSRLGFIELGCCRG